MVRPSVRPLIRSSIILVRVLFNECSIFVSENASPLVVRNNRELYRKLLASELVCGSVKERDKPKLSADYYKVVDIVYDDEGLYVPHCYVCKVCSSVMVVHQEGGNSKLRSHPCVKHFLQNGAADDDCYFINKQFRMPRQKRTLTRVFSKILSVEENKIKKVLPTIWETASW